MRHKKPIMPKKLSVKAPAKQFPKKIQEIREYFEFSNGQKEPFATWSAEQAIILLYKEFELLMLAAIVGAINNDTKTISDRTEVNFPKHLNKGVCEYLVVGDGYFDFKGRSGLIEIIKTYVPDTHYLCKAVADPNYTAALDQLSALRNFAAHDSSKSRQAAYKATGNDKISTAGAWLRTQGRFLKICDSLVELSKEIEKSAPF